MADSVIANVLTIAGTDPSGGAGISADLKTFSALGAFGTCVVTAVVAQNTRGVDSVHQLPAEFVVRQLENLIDDVRIDAVKIGMLGTAEVTQAVAHVLRRNAFPFVVLDPVMVAKSGDRLLATDAVRAMKDQLLPLCDVITPNAPEAADLLTTTEARNEEQLREQADELVSLLAGDAAVLLKGGHLPGPECIDILVTRSQVTRMVAPRSSTMNTHGTGCTLSAAIAALRPQRESVRQAVLDAKEYVTAAIAAADQLDVGGGHGPTHHFHAVW
jgi:hydroxymethylpyrimidine/phosphomethylpyrimidine kinase